MTSSTTPANPIDSSKQDPEAAPLPFLQPPIWSHVSAPVTAATSSLVPSFYSCSLEPTAYEAARGIFKNYKSDHSSPCSDSPNGSSSHLD